MFSLVFYTLFLCTDCTVTVMFSFVNRSLLSGVIFLYLWVTLFICNFWMWFMFSLRVRWTVPLFLLSSVLYCNFIIHSVSYFVNIFSDIFVEFCNFLYVIRIFCQFTSAYHPEYKRRTPKTASVLFPFLYAL